MTKDGKGRALLFRRCTRQVAGGAVGRRHAAAGTVRLINPPACQHQRSAPQRPSILEKKPFDLYSAWGRGCWWERWMRRAFAPWLRLVICGCPRTHNFPRRRRQFTFRIFSVLGHHFLGGPAAPGAAKQAQHLGRWHSPACASYSSTMRSICEQETRQHLHRRPTHDLLRREEE